jgi:hypothetical protein
MPARVTNQMILNSQNPKFLAVFPDSFEVILSFRCQTAIFVLTQTCRPLVTDEILSNRRRSFPIEKVFPKTIGDPDRSDRLLLNHGVDRQGNEHNQVED